MFPWGPLLYCALVAAGCALYYHYNCEDRRKKTKNQSAHVPPDREGDPERKAKRQRSSTWIPSLLNSKQE